MAVSPKGSHTVVDQLAIQVSRTTLATNPHCHRGSGTYYMADPDQTGHYVLPPHSAARPTYHRPSASSVSSTEYHYPSVQYPSERSPTSIAGRVNTSQGWVQTEQRSIVVTSLDYETLDSDIEKLLKSEGVLEDWHFVNPSKRASLIALYRTTEDALQASRALHGKAMGKQKRKIRVKLATDSEAVEQDVVVGNSRSKTDRAPGTRKEACRALGEKTHKKTRSTARLDSPVIANGSK